MPQIKNKNSYLLGTLIFCLILLCDSYVIMPNLYRSVANTLKKGSIIQVSGKCDKENSCLVNKIEFIEVME